MYSALYDTTFDVSEARTLRTWPHAIRHSVFLHNITERYYEPPTSSNAKKSKRFKSSPHTFAYNKGWDFSRRILKWGTKGMYPYDDQTKLSRGKMKPPMRVGYFVGMEIEGHGNWILNPETGNSGFM